MSAARLLAAVGGAASVLACAPLASFRPASGLVEGHGIEVGAGAAALGPREYVVEDWAYASQAWATVEPEQWLAVSAIGAADLGGAALGGAARWNALRADRVALGVEGELGYPWYALSLPAAVRVVDQSWLYTAPKVGNLGAVPAVWLPAGASVRVLGGWSLRAEVQVSWAELLRYNRRLHLGLGTALQW